MDRIIQNLTNCSAKDNLKTFVFALVIAIIWFSFLFWGKGRYKATRQISSKLSIIVSGTSAIISLINLYLFFYKTHTLIFATIVLIAIGIGIAYLLGKNRINEYELLEEDDIENPENIEITDNFDGIE